MQIIKTSLAAPKKTIDLAADAGEVGENVSGGNPYIDLDDQPLSLVNGLGLQPLLHRLEPRYEVTSHHHITGTMLFVYVWQCHV